MILDRRIGFEFHFHPTSAAGNKRKRILGVAVCPAYSENALLFLSLMEIPTDCNHPIGSVGFRAPLRGVTLALFLKSYVLSKDPSES